MCPELTPRTRSPGLAARGAPTRGVNITDREILPDTYRLGSTISSIHNALEAYVATSIEGYPHIDGFRGI